MSNAEIMQKMRNATALLDNDTLLGALMLLPYNQAEPAEIKLSRAVMIDEYIARHGESEGDTLMDALGL